MFLVQKKWYLDVKRTPCAREALLHGIIGGLGIGILYFAKSSECTGSFMHVSRSEVKCFGSMNNLILSFHQLLFRCCYDVMNDDNYPPACMPAEL